MSNKKERIQVSSLIFVALMTVGLLILFDMLFAQSVEIIQYHEPTQSNVEINKKNINHATMEELMEVSGVGEVTAQNIIDYIEEVGEISLIEELGEIKGVGDKTIEAISILFYAE